MSSAQGDGALPAPDRTASAIRAMAAIIARLTIFIGLGIMSPSFTPAQRRHRAKVQCHGALAGLGQSLYLRRMAHVFDLGDRARLRERFYGASHSVLARLNG